MDLPSKHVLHLSRKIGNRYAGSDGEKAAASYILHAMEESDIDVVEESFSSWKSDLQGLALIYLLAVLAYGIFPLNYMISLALAIFVFLVFQMETYTWSVVSRLFPHSKASNIVGRVRATEEVSQRVVVVANYDSSRESPLGRPRIARMYRVLYTVSFICIVIIVLVSMLGVAASLAKVQRHTLFVIWIAISPFTVYILVLFCSILWGEVFGRYTPGANDNASGVGAMLSVLGSLVTNPLEHTEVWGVATARGFAGGRGMAALLRSRRYQIRDAFIINIDHPCGENTRVFTREGVMLGFHCSRRLQRIATRAARNSKGIELGKGRCRVKKSDSMIALARGRKAITIGALTGGAYRGWRNREDVYDEIDRDALDRTVKLVQLMLDEIDQNG